MRCPWMIWSACLRFDIKLPVELFTSNCGQNWEKSHAVRDGRERTSGAGRTGGRNGPDGGAGTPPGGVRTRGLGTPLFWIRLAQTVNGNRGGSRGGAKRPPTKVEMTARSPIFGSCKVIQNTEGVRKILANLDLTSLKKTPWRGFLLIPGSLRTRNYLCKQRYRIKDTV